MHPRVSNVTANEDYSLKLTFTNGEVRRFDVAPLLTVGVFSQLKDKKVFNQVRVFNGTVLWPGEIDLCPDTLYEESTLLNR